MPDIKIFASSIEPQAVAQTYELAGNAAFENQKIRLMPDAHAGKGCVVGFTSTIGPNVPPNIVGSDIGCGMLCIDIGRKFGQRDEDLQKLDEVIHNFVPTGARPGNVFDQYVNSTVRSMACFQKLRDPEKALAGLGSIGSGNHFVELAESVESKNAYMIIHTGSRSLGQQVCEHYMEKAVEHCRGIAAKVPDAQAYLSEDDSADYLHDMNAARIFAKENRFAIAGIILSKLGFDGSKEWIMKNSFTTEHNYIDTLSGIVRKGAVCADEGKMILIPMNMAYGSVICRGKGNEDWNCSAPHGAGRKLRRSDAKEQLSMDEYVESMRGIYTTTVKQATLDESPMAYKDPEEVLEQIGPTAEMVDTLIPLYNFKPSK